MKEALSALEALAQSPIVCTKWRGLTDVVSVKHPNGVLIDNCDPFSIAQALISILFERCVQTIVPSNSRAFISKIFRSPLMFFRTKKCFRMYALLVDLYSALCNSSCCIFINLLLYS